MDNGFTNPDSGVKTRFLNKAELLMQKAMKMNVSEDIDDWTDLRLQAITYCHDYMERAGSTSIKLAELTQYIVLKQSLCYLFDGADEAMKASDTQFSDITYIARRINELWIESKIAKEIPQNEQTSWVSEKDLHEALHRVTVPAPVPSSQGIIPGFLKQAFPWISSSPDSDVVNPAVDPKVPEQNPTNLLLPAYETMWRVVMRCFLEVRHRNAPNGPKRTETLLRYLQELQTSNVNPSEAFYRENEIESQTEINIIRPAEIVKEALRLYPPTRRVHRTFDGVPLSADIETCQRFELLGDDDPLTFRPERWQNICVGERQDFYDQKGADYKILKKKLKLAEEKMGYMPFAFYCAADHASTREFASKMIALLVAVLRDGLGDDWELEESGSLPSTGTPLGSDRADYKELRLKRKVRTAMEDARA
jgi:hypothetical protein